MSEYITVTARDGDFQAAFFKASQVEASTERYRQIPSCNPFIVTHPLR